MNDSVKLAKRLLAVREMIIKADVEKTFTTGTHATFEQVRPVFDKEVPELVDKLNKFFKKNGLSCYFTLKNRLYYSDGYRMDLTFHAEGGSKGKEWWQWLDNLDGVSTKNLVFKRESNNSICLKSTWRPESHRGKVNF